MKRYLTLKLLFYSMILIICCSKRLKSITIIRLTKYPIENSKTLRKQVLNRETRKKVLKILEEEMEIEKEKMLKDTRQEKKIIHSIKKENKFIKKYIKKPGWFFETFDKDSLKFYKNRAENGYDISLFVLKKYFIEKIIDSFDKIRNLKIQYENNKKQKIKKVRKNKKEMYPDYEEEKFKTYDYLDVYLYIGSLKNIAKCKKIKKYSILKFLVKDFLVFLRNNKAEFIDIANIKVLVLNHWNPF